MPKLDSVLAPLGQNVRQRRESRALTQEKLAEKLVALFFLVNVVDL